MGHHQPHKDELPERGLLRPSSLREIRRWGVAAHRGPEGFQGETQKYKKLGSLQLPVAITTRNTSSYSSLSIKPFKDSCS